MFFGPDKREIKIRNRKQIEQVLRHLGMIVEHANEGIVVVDRKGIIHFANTAWARMHGYPDSRNVLGRNIGVFQKKWLGSDVVAFIEEAKHRAELIRMADHVRKDGTKFPAEMKITAIKEKKGKTIGFIVFAADVTEQQQAQDQISRLRQQLRNSADQSKLQSTDHWALESESEDLKQVEEAVLETIEDAEQPEAELKLLDADKLKSLAELARRLT